MEQTGSCRPFCTGSGCIVLNQDSVDFKKAEKACRDKNGELMTFQSETDKIIPDIFSQELYGNFWIGLHLPAGACSNLSAPLRGYEWTSGGIQRSFIPSSSTWKDNIKVCSQHCVSISNDQKWTERPCSDQTEGYLCRTKHKDACQTQELSDSKVFQSTDGCSSGPCQHTCTDVKGGFKCSCFEGYIPDSKNPKQCKLHCAQEECPAICEKGTQDTCFCPTGFIHNNSFCLDINECQMNECEQECKNTFGSYVCSCREGFVLKDQVKCISVAPVITSVIRPAVDNSTLKDSSVTTGGFFWIWIVIVVPVVVVLIFLIRCYVVTRQKRREQNPFQQCTATVDNIESVESVQGGKKDGGCENVS